MTEQAKIRQLAFTMYPYERSADQSSPTPVSHQVVIVGAGPVGLAMALDLGRRGVQVLVLDDSEGIGEGSRAICFAKRTLEICDRLGAADAMMEKGVVWNIGKVFHDDRLLYEFNLLPEDGMPFLPSSTFSNLILKSSCSTRSSPNRQRAPRSRYAARTGWPRFSLGTKVSAWRFPRRMGHIRCRPTG
jgi:hypothetical protein